MYKTSLERDFIITYTKIKMNPSDAKPEDIAIRDIAHALSLMCRANGHLCCFYSVAQHSISCYKEAVKRNYPLKLQLALLLHDASESYLADITRPVKHKLTKYLEIEKNLQTIIYEKFGVKHITTEEQILIDEIDNVMLYYEFLQLAGEKIFTMQPSIIGNYTFHEEKFADVENEFLDIFKLLCDKISNSQKE